MKPRVVAIGGFDPSGRAGVLADCATLCALGAEAFAVVTCLTAQGKRPRSQSVDAKLIAAQLNAVPQVDAVKIGVIPTRAALAVIGRWLDALQLPTVVDPVTVSSRGLRLSALKPRDFSRLQRKFVVLTPNRQEADALQGLRGFGAVVVKSFTPGTDLVFLEGKRPIWLRAKPLRRSPLHRGTGCRFASALAVDLARGHTVTHAARSAKRAVRKFLSTPILQQVQGPRSPAHANEEVVSDRRGARRSDRGLRLRPEPHQHGRRRR